MAKLLAFTLSSVLVLGASEVLLRLAAYDGYGSLENGREVILRTSPHPDVGYELVPNANARAWDAEVEINSLGLRGPELELPLSSRPIVVLGDSITFGNKLPLEETYPRQLEQRLKAEGLAVDVLNFGIGGFDSVQEVALFEHRARSLSPTLVIVGYCLNDLQSSSLNSEYVERATRYASNLLYRSAVFRFVADQIEEIRVGQWVRYKNRDDVFKNDYADKIRPIGPDDGLRRLMTSAAEEPPSLWYRSEDRVGRLRWAFERLSEFSREDGFRVLVVAFPWLEVREPYPHRIAHEIVRHESERLGFDVIDLTDDFLEVGMSKLRIQARDSIHPNGLGHELAADRITEYILEHQGLPAVAVSPGKAHD